MTGLVLLALSVPAAAGLVLVVALWRCARRGRATLGQNVIRPGRLDAVIHIAELDAPGYQRLVRALVPAHLLDPAVDLGVVAEAMAGFLPAFAKEATQRAIRYSLARNEGKPGVITTADLVDAARGMADHIRLMAGAE